MSKTSHYKATTKRGFEAGELASLLASHSPNADYKVVISLRGKVRELIVEEDTAGREAVAGTLHDRDVQSCATPPAPVDDQRHGGKLEATFHDPRTQDFRNAEGQTWPAAPPWPATEDPTDEALNARFGDPRLSNLDRRDGLKGGPTIPETIASMPRRWEDMDEDQRRRWAEGLK